MANANRTSGGYIKGNDSKIPRKNAEGKITQKEIREAKYGTSEREGVFSRPPHDSSLHEILDAIGKETKISNKVEMLQYFEGPGLFGVIRGAYDPTIKWLVPDSTPPHTPNDAEAWDLAPLRLEQAIHSLTMKSFIARKNVEGKWDALPGLTQVRREQQFIELIESLHPTEVKVLFGMVNRKLPYKGVTPKLIEKAFPGLLPEGGEGILE